MNKLIHAENRLKAIVESGSPKTTTIHIQDSNGNIISKQQYINKNIIAQLKPTVDKYEEIKSGSSLYMGGIFPLLALIPAILAGVASAAGVAGGVAAAVNNAKQSQAADKDKELKQAMIDRLSNDRLSNDRLSNVDKLGKGIYLKPHEGRALYDFFKGKGFKLPQLKKQW